MLTLYFSGTGNTEYIANEFSKLMDAKCLSIEAEADFTHEIKSHETIAFCYPIYGSRAPRNLREFTARHMSDLTDKKIIILVTQAVFSGDGARVFTDMFWEDTIEVIYAEHIKMPVNVNNMLIFRKPSEKAIEKCLRKAKEKLQKISRDIDMGIVKKRGFSRFSQFLGNVQGVFWQGNSKEIDLSTSSLEFKAKTGVKIHKECTLCNLCVGICPVKNLVNAQGSIVPQGNCVVCYRCINNCPEKAITVFFNKRPKWQYKGVEKSIDNSTNKQ